MLSVKDILPESNQTLEETRRFGDEFGNIIKKLEEKLKEDPEIKDTIEEIVKGYDKIKNQKKEKIDKIDEMAQIEYDQLEYDHHFEFLVDSLIDVPVIYYREKCIEEIKKVELEPEQPLPATSTNENKKNLEYPDNKTQNIQTISDGKKIMQSSPNIMTQDRKQQSKPQIINVQKPKSGPVVKEQKRLNVHIQKRNQNAPTLQIKKSNANQNNNG